MEVVLLENKAITMKDPWATGNRKASQGTKGILWRVIKNQEKSLPPLVRTASADRSIITIIMIIF